jgi:hypothetical protein
MPLGAHRWLAVAALGAALGATPGAAAAAPTLQLLVDGLARPNEADPPTSAAFETWCADRCFPTTRQVVHDPRTGQRRGVMEVWGRDLQHGEDGSLCFSEFIVFRLDHGQLHVASGERGTCGAPIDPALKPPRHAELGATVVLAGGGDGVIVGGTGRYRRWRGTYTDRAFVGFGPPERGVGGIIYYDQLWFGITRR